MFMFMFMWSIVLRISNTEEISNSRIYIVPSIKKPLKCPKMRRSVTRDVRCLSERLVIQMVAVMLARPCMTVWPSW